MKQPQPKWNTAKLRLLDEHADRNRQPGRRRSRAHAKRDRSSSPARPATTGGPSPSGAGVSPQRPAPRYVRWLEQRHGRWARLGLATLVAILAGALIAAGSDSPAQPELGLAGALLGTGVGVASYGTNMWQQLTPTHPAYQWTASSVLTLGEALLWTLVALAVLVAISIALSLLLIGALLGLITKALDS